MTIQATPFSLVYEIEATLLIEFKVESLQVAVEFPLTDNWSLKNMLTDLEELDERRQMTAQHIEAIQRQRKITFDKRHKKVALWPGMMVMIQDARKLEFPSKFDAVWMGPYLVREAFLNNYFSWRLWVGRASRLEHREIGARSTRLKTTLPASKRLGIQS